MGRWFVTLLGYNSPAMIRGAVENLERTTTDLEHRRLVKTIFDCGYPIGNREKNKKEIKNLAVEFGWWHTEIPNLGVLGNHNAVIHDFYRMEKGDFYFCYDPDVRMQQKGWMSAMVEALNSVEEEVVFTCAALPFHDDEWCWKQHGRTIETFSSGLRIARYQQLLAWSTGCWKGEWLAKRPRDFKAAHPIYSWAEHADLDLMNRHGKKWISLVDFYDHHLGADQIYSEWKVACAKGETMLPMNEWLLTKGRVPYT